MLLVSELSPSPQRFSHQSTHLFCRVRLFATPWTVAYQAPLSMEFPRQEYWSGLPFSILGALPNPGIEPASRASPALAGRSLPPHHLRSLSHHRDLLQEGEGPPVVAKESVYLLLGEGTSFPLNEWAVPKSPRPRSCGVYRAKNWGRALGGPVPPEVSLIWPLGGPTERQLSCVPLVFCLRDHSLPPSLSQTSSRGRDSANSYNPRNLGLERLEQSRPSSWKCRSFRAAFSPPSPVPLNLWTNLLSSCKSRPTVCDFMDCSKPGFPVLRQLWIKEPSKFFSKSGMSPADYSHGQQRAAEHTQSLPPSKDDWHLPTQPQSHPHTPQACRFDFVL